MWTETAIVRQWTSAGGEVVEAVLQEECWHRRRREADQAQRMPSLDAFGAPAQWPLSAPVPSIVGSVVRFQRAPVRSTTQVDSSAFNL